MSILFGHPTGNPNSHQAGLAHAEAGRLEAFCVAWMPSALTVQIAQALPGMNALAQRFGRRRFAALAGAPKVQARSRELVRMASWLSGGDEARLVQDRNDWLMRTMRELTRRPAVTAVHAYEDCSLLPFQEVKRVGKACIYDMPVGYHPAWQHTQAELIQRYADWLPATHRATDAQVRHDQKRREMELADIVLAPSRFADETIRGCYPNKTVALAPYGVDPDFWRPGGDVRRRGPLRFIFAGHVSVRKGVPCLIEAWRKAALRDAELELVGPWHLSDASRRNLPTGVFFLPPCDPATLRERYRAADVLVFPSHFEGFGLVVVEAMATGLPVLASTATIAPEIVTPDCGRVTPAGDVDALVEELRWFGSHRDDIAAMGAAARRQVQHFSWERYRGCVTLAVSPYL